jgi:hypothetical protein
MNLKCTDLYDLNDGVLNFADYQSKQPSSDRYFTVKQVEPLCLFKLQLLGNCSSIQQDFPLVANKLFRSQLNQLKTLLRLKLLKVQQIINSSSLGKVLDGFGLN